MASCRHLSNMERVATIDARHHGKGPLIYTWHPTSQYVVTCGSTRVVHIFDRRGKVVDQIIPPYSTPCLALEWDAKGDTLAVLQSGYPHVLLYHMQTKEIEHVDIGAKDPTFMKWSTSGQQLAVGTGRGDVIMYDRQLKQCWFAHAKHKRRITCGDWNNENKLAFASDDRQITIASSDGSTFGQVKVKSRPTCVKFGGNRVGRENIVSVSMDRKTILLYNLDDPENALELAFQPKYGHIVSFKWFGNGYIMVGFSLGYVVVISTNMEEIGREQFCERFHKDNLRDLAYCAARQKVATCGDNCIKIIDMAKDWKLIGTDDIDKAAGSLDHIEWAQDGGCVSVSSRNGCLFIFSLDVMPSDPMEPDTAAAGFFSEPFTGDVFSIHIMLAALSLLFLLAFLFKCQTAELLLALIDWPVL